MGNPVNFIDPEGKVIFTGTAVAIISAASFISGVYGGYQVASTIDDITSDPNPNLSDAAADLVESGLGVYGAVAGDIISSSLWGLGGTLVGAGLYGLLNNDANADSLTSNPCP